MCAVCAAGIADPRPPTPLVSLGGDPTPARPPPSRGGVADSIVPPLRGGGGESTPDVCEEHAMLSTVFVDSRPFGLIHPACAVGTPGRSG